MQCASQDQYSFLSSRPSKSGVYVTHPSPPASRPQVLPNPLSTGEGTSPRHHPQTQASRFAGRKRKPRAVSSTAI